MTNSELGRILLLPVRLCIAQYADEVRSYIARYWVEKGESVPDLTTANTAQFNNIKIQVKSISSAEWKSRFTDFASLFVTFTSKTFRSAWLFPRILQAVIAELGLSNRQVSDCLLVLFLHQAQSYGRLWNNDCLGGFGMFGIDQDFNGPQLSSLADSGLLTLAHPRDPNRSVSSKARMVLLSRSWTSLPQQSSAAQATIRQGSVSHPAWAKPFFDGLIWPFEFNFAHIPSFLVQRIERGMKPKTEKRAYINAFMLVVLCGLYCRLQHLKAICVSQNYVAFKTLLLEGCKHGDELWQAELKFFDQITDITLTLAKDMLAFYQSGILGLHSCETVCEKLKNLPTAQADFIKALIQGGRFQIDQHWLLDRVYMQAYRAKIAKLELPDWVPGFAVQFGNYTTSHHMKHVSHTPTFWIFPRVKDEVLEVCGEAIPVALRNVVKVPVELNDVSLEASRNDDLGRAWIGSIDNVPISLEMIAVGGDEGEDLVIASVVDDSHLFGHVNSTEVADQVANLDLTCFETISLFLRRWKMPSLLMAMRSLSR